MGTEMGEMWREIKEEQKRERRNRTIDANVALPALRDAAALKGMVLSHELDHHWTLRRGEKVIAQYWPSTLKLQDCAGTGRVRKGVTLTKLLEFIERSC